MRENWEYLAAREKAAQDGKIPHGGRKDATEIPKGFDNSKARNSILEVKQSARYDAPAEMVDNAATEPRASATYTCDKLHCTRPRAGAHFDGRSAKRE